MVCVGPEALWVLAQPVQQDTGSSAGVLCVVEVGDVEVDATRLTLPEIVPAILAVASWYISPLPFPSLSGLI